MMELAATKRNDMQWHRTQFPGLVHRDEAYLDNRPDQDIMAALQQHQPVRSQRNVWAIWDAGFDKMPAWCQRNVLDWIRRLGPSWTVRIVDLVRESKNNIYEFVDRSSFPDSFNSRSSSAAKKQHLSDLMRLALLYHHGGVYMDVSILLFRTLDDICWSAIEDPNLPYSIAVFEYQSRKFFGQILNAFIASAKGDPFIKHWHAIFSKVWEDIPDLKDSHKHGLLHHLGLMQPDDPGFGDSTDFVEFTDYAAHMMAFERLRLLKEPAAGGFNGAEYFKKHVFLLSSWTEQFYGQDRMNGEEMYQLLCLPFEPENVANESQQQAKDLVVGLLSRSAIAKFGEGYWQPGMPLPLPALWKKHPGSDCAPGTWAAYLRWASVHLEQTRRRGTYLEPLKIPDELDEIVRVGVLEPVQR